MEIIKPTQENLKIILEHLKSGKVLVCPTDTVYGFICDARDEKAVEKIFDIKKREKSKPLGIFVKDVAAAKKFSLINKSQESFLKDNKITAILNSKKETLSKLVYKDKTIGIRIPNYEFLNLVLNKFGKPLAQTSANLSGKKTTTEIASIIDQFKNEDIIIIDAGDLPDNKPSKIIDSTKNRINILRK